MSLHIVIDGYNLLYQSRRIAPGDRDDLQTRRQSLIDALAAYRKIRPHVITVVFDGTAAQCDLPRRDRLKGINLRFSRCGELADAVIKRMAAREKERVLVVSSDREIVDYAVGRGAAVMSAPEFEERLALVSLLEEKPGLTEAESDGWNATTRKKGPSRRLPKRERKMRSRTDKL